MNKNSVNQGLSDLLLNLSRSILNGATLEESLDQIYETFHQWIPYDRIGFAEIDNSNHVASSLWHRSNDRVLLRKNYTAKLTGSSLYLVISRRQPRILNDLPTYLEHRPTSRSTALIVKEGITPIESSGKLLLAAGTELTLQSIVRLDLLHDKGMLDLPHVQVDRNYIF